MEILKTDLEIKELVTSASSQLEGWQYLIINQSIEQMGVFF